MAYPENNEKNRFEVAENIVGTWTLQELQEFALRAIEADYRGDTEYFEEEFDNFRDSFEWSQELRESMKKDCPNPGCHCGACDKKDTDISKWQVEDATNGRR